MTEDAFYEALSKMGATQIETVTREVDAGRKKGLGVKFIKGGKVCRNAILIAPDEDDSAGYPHLLKWAATT